MASTGIIMKKMVRIMAKIAKMVRAILGRVEVGENWYFFVVLFFTK